MDDLNIDTPDVLLLIKSFLFPLKLPLFVKPLYCPPVCAHRSLLMSLNQWIGAVRLRQDQCMRENSSGVLGYVTDLLCNNQM